MVIGAIEIDGGRAVPMEMHSWWGEWGSAVFWLLPRAEPQRARPPDQGRGPLSDGLSRLPTFSL